ncbi:olfactory receptor 1E16-like [Pelobates fuscus]|uniref:olfactory receptor 1E16-like n=1 Tax=Pelobates fuscus TaxID=191477 RepID=UPI002FE4D17A
MLQVPEQEEDLALPTPVGPSTPSENLEAPSPYSICSWTIPRLAAELRCMGVPFLTTARKAKLYLSPTPVLPSQWEHPNNRTIIKEFRILGFENIHNIKIMLFLLFLVSYIVTLSANSMIISLVVTSPYISSPMYFFLSHLSITDILLTTTIVPGMLHITLMEGITMSLAGCFIQFYFVSIFAAAECLLLTVMSYDRYLAICNPLRYASIMDLTLCIYLGILSWALGILVALPHVLILSQMTFCGSNIIDHFFCDLVPILNLSCTKDMANEIVTIVLSTLLTLFPFAFITMTYISIFLTILQISTINERQKAFSTCSSHLTVVCLYYGTLVCNYLVPSNKEYLGLQKLVSMLYTIVTPLLNPIIYSLRNKHIRGAVIQLFLKRK